MIVAYSNNRVIGNGNKLPWHIPSDLKRFKAITKDNIVVMGRVTYESLPIRPLPNRINVVITKDLNFDPKDESVVVFHYFSDLFNYVEQAHSNGINAYVIGGASIYTQLLSSVDEVLATEIHTDIIGDTYFPYLSDRVWKQSERIHNEPENGLSFDFVTYKRF